jgi:hypothetical protein
MPDQPTACEQAGESGPSDAANTLARHRNAVRVNLPAHARNTADTVRWLAGQAAYARLPQPTVTAIEQAAEVLGAVAEAITGRVQAEEAERLRLGADRAAYQWRLERGGRP